MRASSLATAVIAAVIGLGAASAGSAERAPRPARTVTVHGLGQNAMRYTAVAHRRSRTRWCVDLSVEHAQDSEGSPDVTVGFDDDGFCGTVRRQDALSLSFACPFGLGASGIARGRPERVEYISADGSVAKVRTRRLRDATGPGVVWATAVAADHLPGRIVKITGESRRTLTRLQSLDDLC